jgi:hypothetical protein
MEEAEDRGWWYGPDKTVCDRHVEDGALAQLTNHSHEAHVRPWDSDHA